MLTGMLTNVTGCAIAQPRGCILTTLTCEAAERSGARSSWLSMLSTRKVIVKESTHHSAQRPLAALPGPCSRP